MVPDIPGRVEVCAVDPVFKTVFIGGDAGSGGKQQDVLRGDEHLAGDTL